MCYILCIDDGPIRVVITQDSSPLIKNDKYLILYSEQRVFICIILNALQKAKKGCYALFMAIEAGVRKTIQTLVHLDD